MLGLLHAVHQRLHAGIIQTIRFHHINDINPVFLVLPRVRNNEIKPLDIAISLVIRLQNEVILILVSKNRPYKYLDTSGWLFWDCRFQTATRISKWYLPWIAVNNTASRRYCTVWGPRPLWRGSGPRSRTRFGSAKYPRSKISQFLCAGNSPVSPHRARTRAQTSRTLSWNLGSEEAKSAQFPFFYFCYVLAITCEGT